MTWSLLNRSTCSFMTILKLILLFNICLQSNKDLSVSFGNLFPLQGIVVSRNAFYSFGKDCRYYMINLKNGSVLQVKPIFRRFTATWLKAALPINNFHLHFNRFYSLASTH